MIRIDQLEVVSSALSAKDQVFAASLIANARRMGHLSAGIEKWVVILLDRAASPAKPQGAQIGDLSSVAKLFEAAKASGLKNPKIRLDGGFVLSLAGESSVNAGQIYVKGCDAAYMGKIDGQGVYRSGRDVVASDAALVVKAVSAFACDPLGAASRYGVDHGDCCFCGRLLTDKKSGGSVAMGYGPICAKKFGLAHGASAVAKQAVVVADASVATVD